MKQKRETNGRKYVKKNKKHKEERNREKEKNIASQIGGGGPTAAHAKLITTGHPNKRPLEKKTNVR